MVPMLFSIKLLAPTLKQYNGIEIDEEEKSNSKLIRFSRLRLNER